MAIGLAACAFGPPGAGSDAEPGSDGTGVRCDPAAAATCLDDDTIHACRSDGSDYVDRTCALGCLATPAAHCLGIVPSNGLGVQALLDGEAELDTASTGGLVIETDTGAIRRDPGGELVRAAGEGFDAASKIFFRIVAQPSAPSIGVFSFASLRVAPGTTLRARGRNALALVAQGAIAIDGILNLTGGPGACGAGDDPPDHARCAGPGGGAGGDHDAAAPAPGGGGGATGGPSGFAESGGGGGGHGGAGGIGGQGLTMNTTRGASGPAFGSPSLEPLTGGGGGGGGGDEPQTQQPGASGGGGGGAVQLVSNTAIRIGPATGCGINAGGAGAGQSFSSSGGAGGGAGGGVLLEAPEVALGAGCGLAANGGGGSGAHLAQPGTTGLLSTMPAAGSREGSNGTRSAGNGGDGGAAADPTAGGDGNDESGGGGGGSGVMRVNTRDGSRFTQSGIVSPSATMGAVVLE